MLCCMPLYNTHAQEKKMGCHHKTHCTANHLCCFADDKDTFSHIFVLPFFVKTKPLAKNIDFLFSEEKQNFVLHKPPPQKNFSRLQLILRI